MFDNFGRCFDYVWCFFFGDIDFVFRLYSFEGGGFDFVGRCLLYIVVKILFDGKCFEGCFGLLIVFGYYGNICLGGGKIEWKWCLDCDWFVFFVGVYDYNVQYFWYIYYGFFVEIF